MRPKPRVVFDTNIYISAIIFGGNPRRCLEMAREGSIALVASKEILFELAQKLKAKFSWQDADIKDIIEGIGVFATIVAPKKHLRVIMEDPEDDRILEASLEGEVDYIISGDKKHLLSLKRFRDIVIISAADFLKIGN